jgi:hypothetical protein
VNLHADARDADTGAATVAGRVRVRAVVWGIHRDAEIAALNHLLGKQWLRAYRFEVVGADFVITGAPCPLDLKDPYVLARKATYGWAWILRAADDPHPAATLELGEPGERTGVAGERGGV